jgi:glycosyltransferase involved in cell wall biosynthesis
MPRVSVIIPNYNHSPYLQWRVDSILQQTFQDFDVTLLDDASTDDSLKILESYARRPGVRLVRNTVNSGSVFRQWENGIKRTDSQYVWIAESDDWADPRFLERLVGVLDSRPEVGLAYSQSWIADTNFKITGNAVCWTEELDPVRWKSDYVNHGRREIQDYLLDRNTIPNASAVVMRRTALEAARPIHTDFRLCGDWIHWIRMLASSDISFVAESLNFWRLNSSNARTSAPGTLEWKEGERVLTEASLLLGLDDFTRDRVLLKFIRKCWRWQADYIESRIPAR